MLDVAVIADDLTGAADCGIALAAAGLPTFVAVGEASPPRSQVVAFDTDSRALPEREAVERTRRATERALAAGARAVYRKLDSTLRGHVGPELAAVVSALAAVRGGRPLCLLAPAFPATGRTTRGGRVLVNGVPLEATEVWRDARAAGPAEPAAMLGAAGLAAEVIPLDAVRGGPGALRGALEGAAAVADAVVCDAEVEADLAAIALAAAGLDRPVAWAGSAGLARHLPRALGLRPAGPGPAAVAGEGPIVALVGSRSSVARAQARALAAEPGVVRVALPPAVLLAGERHPGWPRGALGAALSAGRDVLAVFGEEPVPVERGPELAAAAARLVAPLAQALGALIATGGDVARAVVGALGATGLHLAGEVEPGVPVGVADSAPPLTVVTKAGAFGSPETLVRARAALRARRAARAGAGEEQRP